MTDRDPLRVRLFGYGVPYRVKFGPEGAVQPLETGPAKEAEDLARELAALAGLGAEEGVVEEGAIVGGRVPASIQKSRNDTRALIDSMRGKP